MRFLGTTRPPYDLTYSDVFMVPSLSAVAVAPRRRSHHARRPRHDHPGRRGQHDRRRRPAHGRDRGPPGRPHRAAAGHPARRHRPRTSRYVKTRHPVYETPITLGPHDTVGDALGLIHKRAHGAVVVVDDDGAPVGHLHRARRRRLRPVHPAAERDEQRPRRHRGRHRARGDLRAPRPAPDQRGAGGRRDGRLIGCVTRTRRAALDDLPPAVDARRPADDRGRRRHQRRPGTKAKAPSPHGRRRARHRHRPRPPGPDAARHRGGARGRRRIAADRGRQRRHAPRARAT